MGDLTRAELRTELILNVDNRFDNTVTEARLNLWLLWGYRYVCMPSVYRHRQMQGEGAPTMTAEQGHLDDVPTDLWAIRDLTNSTRGRRLHPRAIHDFDSELARDGEPLLYAVWGWSEDAPKIHVRDVPTSTYASDTLVLRYWKRPDDFASDADTTDIAPEFDLVVVEAAKWRGYATLPGMHEAAEMARVNFFNMLNDVADPMQVEGEDTGATVEVVVHDAMPL